MSIQELLDQHFPDNPDKQVDALITYITNQGDDQAFIDFLREYIAHYGE